MRRFILILSLLSATCSLTRAESFASGADVLLIAGIAGDVESESEYEEITGNLVGWLSQIQPPPASVTVFTDSRIELSGDSLKLQKFGSTREAVLKFADNRPDDKRPLVCFVWGHGGVQKETPILHVKGPRITPADLNYLREKWPDQPSFWTLAFRQSGAFAAGLASDLAQILSSEGPIVFSSDPVLMLQASRVLREKPALSFEDYAQEAAKLIGNAYKEKGTARTEEPLLWNGKEQPALLLKEKPMEAIADATPSPTPGGEKGPETSPNEVAHESRELWNKIKAVDAKYYPDDNAVILSRTMKYVLGSNPAMQTESDQYVQILTPEGASQGDIELSYNPPGENLDILDCELKRPDGKIVRVAVSSSGDATDPAEPGYATAHKKRISIPGIEPGSILRLHYRRSWKNFPLPHLFVETDLALPVPAVKTDIEIRVAQNMAFSSVLQGAEHVEPQLETTNYGKIYRWHFDHLPGRPEEILSPPESGARLLASTFPDWDAFAGWYERLIKLADVPNAEITEKAKELTKDAKTDLDKVKAVYNYVAALRYVMIPLGVNSHRPHSAENTFRNQYGDCKDKANLFNTMLGTLGIKAHLVLVPRFTQADERVPGMAFNHAISRVELPDQKLWIDTTDPTCRFGMLPPGDPGRKVLVIDGQSRTLELLPYPDPELHVMRISGTVNLTDLQQPKVTIDVRPNGFSDYMLRVAAGAWNEKSAYPVLQQEFYTPNGDFILEKQKNGPIADLSKQTWWEASGGWAGLLSALDANGTRQLLRAPLWLPDEWCVVSNRRTRGTQLNKGYPIKLEEAFRFELPSGTKVEELRSSSGEAAGLFKWSCQWKEAGDGKLEARYSAELARGDLDQAETERFGKELARMLTALATGPIVTVTK